MKANFKLIIGLGNPDKKYAATYHNAGHLFIDYLQNSALCPSPYVPCPMPYALIKSDSYMNDSGRFVAKMLKKHNIKPENLLVVHDDSDLKIGAYKLVFGRGAAGHHGAESVQAALKTKGFWRLRIGIRPSPAETLAKEGRRPKAGEFVLKKISVGHKKILEETFKSAAEELTN